MPNWCECDLVVTGPAEDVKRFIDALKVADDGKCQVGILDAHFPMPTELSRTNESSRGPEWVIRDPDGNWQKDQHLPMTDVDAARLVSAYGFSSWYGWCNERWGTKWGDCRTCLTAQVDGKVSLTFESAWCAPKPGLTEVSKRFHALSFDLRYYEMGMGFQGHWVCVNGEVVTDTSEDYDGLRGG